MTEITSVRVTFPHQVEGTICSQKTRQKNIGVKCDPVYFHVMDRCFPSRFVLDFQRVSRMCQQAICQQNVFQGKEGEEI